MGGEAPHYNPPPRPEPTKPSDYTPYDNSNMVNSMIRNIEEGVSGNIAKTGAQGSARGVGRSSSTLGGMEKVIQGGQNQMADTREKAAYDQWQDQVAQQRYADDLSMKEYGIDMGNYDKQMALEAANKAKGLMGLGMFGL